MSACKAKMPHAILIPLPAQGHVNPMMQLAWKLVSDGFIVTFVNTDSNHKRMSEATDNRSMHGNRDMLRMVSVPDGLPPEDCRNDILRFFTAAENALRPSVIDKIIQEINEKEEHKVTCIIADVWTCFGLKTVAKLYDISLAALHTSLVSTCAFRYFSSRIVSLGLLPSDGIPKEEKVVKYLSSMPPIYSGHLPWLYGGEQTFRLGIRMGEEISEIKWILFNTFHELEPPVVDELSKEVGVYPIGPLIPSEFLGGHRGTTKIFPSLREDEMECLDWLDKQSDQSVIYISFGSFAVLNKRQLEELCLALQAMQRPFLWVVRSDLMDGSEAVLPPGFLERVRDRGCVVSWAPQLRVLSHPSIACFVTHCGWNSTQESITMGVPMLCWPYFADQFINCKYIVDVWKVGLPLNANNDGIIEKGEFTNALEGLLEAKEGVEIRKEANKLKTIARDTVKEGGSSYNNYNLFVKAMKKPLYD
uniref:Glycosyltransferase n=1 Tax=Araucaria cunninghamii TaxID=56994 RepID=A0A0D6QUZ6_ARACU